MKALSKLALASVLASLTAAPASAATYVLTNDGVLNATIITNDANTVVTGISGTFLGASITGLIANPYGTSRAHYNTLSGNITPFQDNSGPSYGYWYDNFLINGALNTNGILFETATNVANVYTENGSTDTLTNLKNAPTWSVVPGNTTITSVSAAVPEPATWALTLVGFGAIGYSMRRRRRTASLRFQPA